MNDSELITLSDIYKVYDSGEVPVHALRGVTLEIVRGEFVAIMGASGSGKSTLMNILGCLDRPTSGQYWFDGREISKVRRKDLARLRNESLGFIFQSFNLLKRTPALENVMLPLLYAANGRGRDGERRARTLLAKLGLAGREDHTPTQLSGGEQQRVAVARALINDPLVVLADEPTGNLDSRTAMGIMAEFQRLNRELGQTIIMVTHEADIAACASRIIVMRDGRILSDHANTETHLAADRLSRMASDTPEDAPWVLSPQYG